tara:strand:- start:340 stop:915 length:576 start_codon:yes stop_codon:yes gene_type:complete
MGTITRTLANNCTTHLGLGSLVKLSDQTVTNVAAVTFDLATLDSSREFTMYRLYQDHASATGTSNNLEWNIGTNTSSYITSGYQMMYMRGVGLSGTPTLSALDNGSSFITWTTNDDGGPQTLVADIIGLNRASSEPSCFGHRTFQNYSGDEEMNIFSGRYYTAGDYRALRCDDTAGGSTINGRFVLYGVRN